MQLRQQQGDTAPEDATDASTGHNAAERLDQTMDVENGQDIINELLEHTTSQDFCYAHAWQRGDVRHWIAN
eukprot:COSAG02_NODE_7074_length_3196_cov_3.087405_4_plen_71_part_00